MTAPTSDEITLAIAEIEAEFTRVVQEAAKVATLKRLALESKAGTR